MPNGLHHPPQERQAAAMARMGCLVALFLLRQLAFQGLPPQKNQRTMLPTLFRFGASQIECFQVPSWSFSNLLSFLATLSSLLVIFTSRQCIQRLEVGGVGAVSDISCFLCQPSV